MLKCNVSGISPGLAELCTTCSQISGKSFWQDSVAYNYYGLEKVFFLPCAEYKTDSDHDGDDDANRHHNSNYGHD